MATTTRKTTTRRPRAAGTTANGKPAPIVLDDDDEDPFAEREPLFSLGGKVYTIPVVVPVVDVLHYGDLWMEQGVTAALMFALRSTLGEDGYRALLGHRKLKQSHMDAIFKVVQGKFDGSEDPKGRRSNG